MSQKVIQQLASLLNAFSADFEDAAVRLNIDSGAVIKSAGMKIFKEISEFELHSDSEGTLNKLAYRVGSVEKSSVKTFLHNTSISSLKLTSLENQPLSISESDSSFNSGVEMIELVYKGSLKLNWTEKDYYFYMSPDPTKSGSPKESIVQVERLKLTFRPDGQYQLLDCYDANDSLAGEQMMCFELSGVLDQPVNELFKFINITATSTIPVESDNLFQLPLKNIEMVIG